MSKVFSTAGSRWYIGPVLTYNDTDLAAADFSALSYVEVGGCTNMGTFGDSAELITSNHIANSRTRKLKGVMNAGSVQLIADLDYSDTGQLALVAAQKLSQSYAFKVTLGDVPGVRSAVATMTIAAPGVVTWAAHGLSVNDAISFSTTGALPTGLVAGTTYYVKTAPDANTFTLSATAGGAAITTTGSQSGVHTVTTVPVPSTRYFTALVMSVGEQLDEANNTMKLNSTLEIDSNVVKVAAIQ